MTENKFMALAIKEAEKAAAKNEVPVGAVIVSNGEVIAAAHNLRESQKCALAHAELLAIKAACAAKGNWRLSDCSIYVTLEPCAMCAGAIINARIARLYFGAYDAAAGAAGGRFDLFSHGPAHQTEVYGSIMESECAALLSSFFKKKRDGGEKDI